MSNLLEDVELLMIVDLSICHNYLSLFVTESPNAH